MNPLESFGLAIRNILASKTRALLTMLGIIIGVAAVIIIIGLGDGLKGYVTDSFASLGTRSLTVTITGRGSSSHAASVEDLYRIVDENPTLLESISPSVPVNALIKINEEEADDTSATGVGEDFFALKQYELETGRGLTYADMRNREAVCVIGSYTAETWFGGDAVGQTLRIGGRPYRVVGTLVQETDGVAEAGGTDDAIYLPYSTASRFHGQGAIGSYTINVVSEETASEARVAVENGLYRIYRDEDAYRVISMTEMLGMMDSMINIIITVLAIIAGISLVVGGIGIMNIMLVSVTERTREIGIRKAMGAKERYILLQFVIEAATTSAFGGALGIGLGMLLCSMATFIVTNMLATPLTVTPTFSAIALSFGVSAAIGILFGYLPAKRAASLNPIDALRHE